MKTYSIKKGASISKDDLNPYDVGLLRLHEMAIAVENFSDSDITHIGYCSIHRIDVVLCKVGNFWGIRGRMGEQLKHNEHLKGYRGHVHAYWMVSGKKVKALRPHFNGTAEELVNRYNSRDFSKPLNEMSAIEIFRAAQGKKPGRRHAPKMRVKERIASAARMEKL